MVSHALQLALLGLNNTLESCPVPGQNTKPSPYSGGSSRTSRPSDGFRSNPGPRNPRMDGPRPPRTTRWRQPNAPRIPARKLPQPGVTSTVEKAAEKVGAKVARSAGWKILKYGVKFFLKTSNVIGWIDTANDIRAAISEEHDARQARLSTMRRANAAHMASGEGDYLELLRSAPYRSEPSHAMELERAEREEKDRQQRECLKSGGSFRFCFGIPDLSPEITLPKTPKLTTAQVRQIVDHLGLPTDGDVRSRPPEVTTKRRPEVVPPQIEIATRERLSLLEDHELELLQASKDPVEVYLASQLLAERQMEREIAERREQERQRANGGPTIIGSGKIVHDEKSAPGPKHGRTRATPVASTGEGPKNAGTPASVGSAKGQPGSKPAGPDEVAATGSDESLAEGRPDYGGQPVAVAPEPADAARIRRPEGANAVPVVKVEDDTGEKMLSARTRYDLGRDRDQSHIVLSDPRVGAKHASIFYAEGRGWFIRDAGSADGTYVNNQRLASLTVSTPLQDGDTIKMGSTRYRAQIKGSELSLQRLFTERVVQTEAGQHVRLRMVTEVDGTGTLRYVYRDARGTEWAEGNFKAETVAGQKVVKIAYIITDPQVGGQGLSQDLINEATAATSMVWSVVDNIPTHNALLQAQRGGKNLETIFAETPLGKLHERAGFTHHVVERFRGTFHIYSSRTPFARDFVPHWRVGAGQRVGK